MLTLGRAGGVGGEVDAGSRLLVGGMASSCVTGPQHGAVVVKRLDLLGAQLDVPAHFLGQAGEVLPQLAHTGLQLVPLTQQLLLLTNLHTDAQAVTLCMNNLYNKATS